MKKQERIDSLLSKLAHPLVDIRQRSLQNLAFKVSSGLVPPERVVSDVVATRSLVSLLKSSSSSLELSETLHILELVATKDSWSAAVLVDAGALDAVQILLDSSNTLESKLNSNATDQDQDSQRLKTLARVLLSVPPQKVNQIRSSEKVDGSLSNNNQNYSFVPVAGGSVGRKVESPPRRDTKRPDTPDCLNSMMATSSSNTSSSTSTSTSMPVATARGGWCFPRVVLNRHDDQLLFRAKAELSCGDPSRQRSVIRQLTYVLFSDFPGEIWLQRPEIFRMLLTLVRSTKESNIPSDLDMLESSVKCLKTLLQQWKYGLKRTLDHDLHTTDIMEITGNSSSSNNNNISTTSSSTTYPSSRPGTIVFTPTSSTTSSISLGDATLMIFMSSIPTSKTLLKQSNILLPLLTCAMDMLAEPFPIHHVALDGSVVDHITWTSSRYQTVVDALSRMLPPVEDMLVNDKKNSPYRMLLHCLCQHIISSGLNIVDKDAASSSRSVSLSSVIVSFVRKSLFCHQGNEDDLDSDVWSTLYDIMRWTDLEGSNLMDLSENIASAARDVRGEYHQTSTERAIFLKHVRQRVSVIDTSDGTHDQNDQETDTEIALVCRDRAVALSSFLPSLMATFTTADEVELTALASVPVVGRSVCACVIGDVVALCCLSASITKQNEDEEENVKSLLVRLLSFPIPRVRSMAYEQLLSVLTLRQLVLGSDATANDVSENTETWSIRSSFVINAIVERFLSSETVMSEILHQGLSDRLVRSQAETLARIIASLSADLSENVARRMQQHVPILACLSNETVDVAFGAADVLTSTMTREELALLHLQDLTHAEASVRHSASRHLRKMSEKALAARECATDEYVDPAMLRQPLPYTCSQWSCVSRTTSTDITSEEGSSGSNASDFRRVAGLLLKDRDKELEEVLWIAAAEQSMQMLLRNVEGDVATACGADKEDRDENTLLQLASSMVSVVEALEKQRSTRTLTLAYELLLVLAGHCTACYRMLIGANGPLLNTIVPDVFHPNSSVRFSVHRLILLLVFHPARTTPQLMAEHHSSNGNNSVSSMGRHMRLVDTKRLGRRSKEHQEIDVIVPILHLADIVLSSRNNEVLSLASSVIHQTFFPSRRPGMEYDIVGVHLSNRISRIYMLRYVHGHLSLHSPADDIRVRSCANNLLRNVTKATSHAEMISSTLELGRQCALHHSIRDAVGSIESVGERETTAWLPPFRRFLKIRPTCIADVRVLTSIVKTLATIVPGMNDASLFALSSITKTSILPILRSGGCGVHRRNAKDNDGNDIVAAVLRSKMDLYAEVGNSVGDGITDGVSLQETAKTELYVSCVRLLRALTREVRGRPVGDVVQETLLYIVFETRALPLLLDTFQDSSLFAHSKRRPNQRWMTRTDVVYECLRCAVEMYLCVSKSIPLRRGARGGAERGTQTEVPCTAPLIRVCVRLLASIDYQRFGRSTLVRSATTLLAHACKTGKAVLVLTESVRAEQKKMRDDEVKNNMEEVKEEVEEGKKYETMRDISESKVSQVSQVSQESIRIKKRSRNRVLSWCTKGSRAKDTFVRAQFMYISTLLNTLKWRQCDEMEKEKNADEENENEWIEERSVLVEEQAATDVVPSIRSAMQWVLSRTQPPIVRSTALDAIVASMEICLTRSAEEDDAEKSLVLSNTAEWLSCVLVQGGVLADFMGVSEANQSIRCATSASRALAFCTLVLRDVVMRKRMYDVMTTSLLLTSLSAMRCLNIDTCWSRSLSSLRRNTYCPNNDMWKIVMGEVLLPPPRSVELMSTGSKRGEKNDNEGIAESVGSEGSEENTRMMMCSCLVVETAHALWEEVHSPSVSIMQCTTISSLRTLLDEKEEEEEEVMKGKKMHTMQKTTMNVPDYGFKYDDDEDEREDREESMRQSMEAAMSALAGYWNILDEQSGSCKPSLSKRRRSATSTTMTKSVMGEMTKLLCTLVPLCLAPRRSDRSQRNSMWPSELPTDAIEDGTTEDDDSRSTDVDTPFDLSLLTSLVERGISDADDDLSAASTHLLWLLLESNTNISEQKQLHIVSILNVSKVTDVLITKYMRTFTNRSSNSQDETEQVKNTTWWNALRAVLRQTSNGSSLRSTITGSEVACNMGVIYFALNQLEKCHRILLPIFGQSATKKPQQILAQMEIHYSVLAHVMMYSSVARLQCVRFDGAEILQKSWSVLCTSLSSSSRGPCGGIVCGYLRVLSALTMSGNSGNSENGGGEFVHHDVFGIPCEGGDNSASAASGVYFSTNTTRNSNSRCNSSHVVLGQPSLHPILPATSQPTSLLTHLLSLWMERLERMVKALLSTSTSSSSAASAVYTDDLEILHIVGTLTARMARDVPTSRVLARAPVVRNLLVLLGRLCTLDTKRTKSSLEIQRAREVQNGMLHVLLSMSMHVHRQGCFHISSRGASLKNDDVDAYNVLLKTWRKLCSLTKLKCNNMIIQQDVALLGHVLRNLAMANKSRFMAHPTLVEDMLESVLRADAPIVVASAASVLWSISYNCKKIIPRMKRCQAESIFQRGLEILQLHMLKETSDDRHLQSMLANGVQGLVRLTQWCKTNGMSRKVGRGTKGSP